jgi:broad specificity phosphatase PhoE
VSGRPRLFLVRHGETEWAASGRHTGWTDIPLNDRGRRQAKQLKERLDEETFALVMSSPLSRALETCRLVGLGDHVVIDPDLREWDYGAYEGLTTDQIRQKIPGWTIWSDRVRDGEPIATVAARLDRMIARALEADGDVALFAHGHALRILAARWLGLEPAAGAMFALSTATISRLGWERERRVIELWNEAAHLEPE